MTSTLLRAGTVSAAVVTLAGLVLGASLSPVATRRPKAVEVRVGVNAVCPVVDPKEGAVYTAAAALTDGVNLQALTGGATRELASNSMIEVTKPLGPLRLIVPPGGHGAGVSLTGETGGLNAGLAASRCEDPATSAWFVGVPSSRQRVTQIVLSNSDETPAEVDLTFYGAGGRLIVATGHSIVVRPNETRSVSLEPLFTDSEPVTVAVRSPQGRVSAFARVRGLAGPNSAVGTGVDWHGQSVAPRKDLVIPGIPAGSGGRHLVIVNPSKKRALVAVSLMGRDGSSPVAELAQVPVRAESTTMIDVSQALGQERAALHLTSDTEVTASLLVDNGTTNPDFAVAPATPIVNGAALLPVSLHGHKATVDLANVSASAGSVQVVFFSGNGVQVGTPTVVKIPAGASASVPVPSDGLVSARIQTEDGIEVAAAMVLSGKTGPLDGLAIVPFHASSSSAQYTIPEQDSRVGS